jgi:hypothetical protein
MLLMDLTNAAKAAYSSKHKNVITIFLLLVAINVFTIVAYQNYENHYLVAQFSSIVSTFLSGSLSFQLSTKTRSVEELKLLYTASQLNTSQSAVIISTILVKSTTSEPVSSIQLKSDSMPSTSAHGVFMKIGEHVEQFKMNHEQIVTNLKQTKFCYVGRNGNFKQSYLSQRKS